MLLFFADTKHRSYRRRKIIVATSSRTSPMRSWVSD